MKPITPKRVGEIWAIDIAMFPESHGGERYMLVIMKYLSKWVLAVPLKSFDSGPIVQVLLYEVVLKYGLPTRLISDNGSNYIAEAMAMVCKSLEDKPNTENESGYRGWWAMYLPFVVFACDTGKQSSTKFSPFQVMFERSATLSPLKSLEVNQNANYNTRQWVHFLNQEIPVIHVKAIGNIEKAQEQQQSQYNKKTKDIVRFKTGDLVLRKNHSKMIAFRKERWLGPWQVAKATNKDGSAYRIMKPGDVKTLSKVNVFDLRPFYRRVDVGMVH